LHTMPPTAQSVSHDGRPAGHIDAQVGSIPRVRARTGWRKAARNVLATCPEGPSAANQAHKYRESYCSCRSKHVIPVEYRPSRFDTNTAKEPYSTPYGGGGTWDMHTASARSTAQPETLHRLAVCRRTFLPEIAAKQAKTNCPLCNLLHRISASRAFKTSPAVSNCLLTQHPAIISPNCTSDRSGNSPSSNRACVRSSYAYLSSP
jgi:hypothetical protein